MDLNKYYSDNRTSTHYLSASSLIVHTHCFLIYRCIAIAIIITTIIIIADIATTPRLKRAIIK